MTTTDSKALPPELGEKLTAKLTPHQVARLRAQPKRHDSQRDLIWGAAVMKRAAFTDPEIETALRAKFSDYYRTIDDREYQRAIENVDLDYVRTSPRWPAKDARFTAGILASSTSNLDTLRAQSPVKNPDEWSPGAIIDRLFKPGDLICLGYDKALAVTEPRTFFVGNEDAYQFIVPNPMSARVGKTTDGRPSVRCLSNTGLLRYQVIEFDSGTQDEQASLLLHLATFNFVLRLVVHSGNKSLHGWFDVSDLSTDMVSSLRYYAAELGADRAMFTPCQFARMPNGTRDNGETQSALYLS